MVERWGHPRSTCRRDKRRVREVPEHQSTKLFKEEVTRYLGNRLFQRNPACCICCSCHLMRHHPHHYYSHYWSPLSSSILISGINPTVVLLEVLTVVIEWLPLSFHLWHGARSNFLHWGRNCNFIINCVCVRACVRVRVCLCLTVGFHRRLWLQGCRVIGQAGHFCKEMSERVSDAFKELNRVYRVTYNYRLKLRLMY